MSTLHRPDPERCTPYCTGADHVQKRPLVTLHLPLDMGTAARVLQAVADGYPDAVMGENGEILGWEEPAR